MAAPSAAMSVAIGLTLIACPMGFDAEFRMFGQVTLPSRLSPETGMPSSALSWPTARNGNSGKGSRQKASSPDKCCPLTVTAFAHSRGRAQRPTGSMRNSSPLLCLPTRSGTPVSFRKTAISQSPDLDMGPTGRKAQTFPAEVRAHQKLGAAAMSDDIDPKLEARLDILIKELEDRITRTITSDDILAGTAIVLRAIPRFDPVASTMMIAEMPGRGAITGEEAAALAGLAPIAHDSGNFAGNRPLLAGVAPRPATRDVPGGMGRFGSQPDIESLLGTPAKSRKPHKAIITAITRKLVNLAKAFCRTRQKCVPAPPSQIPLPVARCQIGWHDRTDCCGLGTSALRRRILPLRSGACALVPVGRPA